LLSPKTSVAANNNLVMLSYHLTVLSSKPDIKYNFRWLLYYFHIIFHQTVELVSAETVNYNIYLLWQLPEL